jgi:hypothetical protein
VIIYRSQVKRQTHLQIGIIQQWPHLILNVIQCVHLLIIRQKHVSVYLVDKHFIWYVLVNVTCHLYDVSQSSAWLLILLLLCVYHVYQRTALLYGGDVLCIVFFEFLSAWEVSDCKLNERVIVNFCKLWYGNWGFYSMLPFSKWRWGRMFHEETSSRRQLSKCWSFLI